MTAIAPAPIKNGKLQFSDKTPKNIATHNEVKKASQNKVQE